MKARFGILPGVKRDAIPGESAKDAFQRRVVDKFIRAKRYTEAAKRAGTLTEGNNFYEAEEAYHGRASARLEDLHVDHTEPIIGAIHKAGLAPDEVGQYLIAKHAKDRNRAMIEARLGSELEKELPPIEGDLADITGSMHGRKYASPEEISEAMGRIPKDLSGMSDKRAAETLADFESQGRKVFEGDAVWVLQLDARMERLREIVADIRNRHL